MAKNMVFLVHKTNSSVIYTNSKSDLAAILGVSLRTIIRNYSNVGKYESMHYIIYVGAEKYDNGKEYNYNHIVEPPVVKTYSSIKSPTITNNVDIVSHSNRVVEHIKPIEDEPIEELLLPSQQHEYYLNLLKGQSQEYAFKKFCEWRYSDKPRAMIIQSIADKMFDIVRE